MHNLLNQPQYYNALKGRRQDDESGITFGESRLFLSVLSRPTVFIPSVKYLLSDGIIRAPLQKVIPDEPDNQTDVEECIK